MFERKLIRHPHGHEEVLIVDGAVLRQHDFPLMDKLELMMWELSREAIKEWVSAMRHEVMTVKESRNQWRGIRIPMRVVPAKSMA